MAYLQSAREAMGLYDEKANDSLHPSDRDAVIARLADFADPEAGLLASAGLFGDYSSMNVDRFASICSGYPVEALSFQPDFITAAKHLQETGLYDEYLDGFLFNLQQIPDPRAFVESLERAEAVLQEQFPAEPAIRDGVIFSRDPSSSVDGLIQAKAFLAGCEPLTSQLFRRAIINANEPLVEANDYVHLAEHLRQRGVDMGKLDWDSTIKVQMALTNEDSYPEVYKKIDAFATARRVTEEFTRIYGNTIAPLTPEQIAPYALSALKPTLKDLPSLRTVFDTVGLSEEQMHTAFDSWNSYDPLGAILSNKHEEDPDYVCLPADKEAAVSAGSMHIREHTEALQAYAEAHGNNELAYIIETFGIVNFREYDPVALHEQLESWKANESSYENIVITTRSDWNGAFTRREANLKPVLGPSTVYLEAGSSIDIAKALVAYGNRERAGGRNPLAEAPVKNIIISGHGSPDGILLGSDGQQLDIYQYMKREKMRNRLNNRIQDGEPVPVGSSRINDYRRHLGSEFRIILDACSTDGNAWGSTNLAQTLTEQHAANTAGYSAPTYGAFKILPDNSVAFHASSQLNDYQPGKEYTRPETQATA